MKPSFFSLTREHLTAFLKERGFVTYANGQIFSWVYKRFLFGVDSWSNVAKSTRMALIQEFDFSLPKVIWHGLSKDGTRKFLLQFSDGESVEAVTIPAKDRLTICLSSQVGCAIGCTFCHTATQGFKRHLSTGEVVGQFLTIQRWLIDNVSESELISNIVYMGQGEPLHNFENMKNATLIFMDDFGLGLGQRRITLSTSGLVPQIEKLIDFPTVNFAISLHAAHDNIRDELMPINRVYDLHRLFTAIKTIPLKAHRHITYEYLLIDGLNDREEDIAALVNLIPKGESKINLIPFNEYPASKFKRPSMEKVLWFMSELIRKGYPCTVRATKGSDIFAACGQLKSAVTDRPNLPSC